MYARQVELCDKVKTLKTHMSKYTENLLKSRSSFPLINFGYREHTAPLFMESKIMTIYQLNYYMVCIFMYKYHHSQLPAIVDNMFITNDNIYTHSTRQRIMYQVPRCRLESKHNSLCFVGVRYFNTILSPSNLDILYSCSIYVYKMTLKESISMSINIS